MSIKMYDYRVVFAFELGGNTGHLVRSVPIIRSLIADGAKVVPIVSDAKIARLIFGPAGIRFLTARPALIRAADNRLIINHADSLMDAGYDNDDSLDAIVSEWMAIIDAIEPDLVIADYAPSALLACRIMNTPSISIGNGFDQPPAKGDLPLFPLLMGLNRDPVFAEKVAKKGAEISIDVQKRINRILNKYSAKPIEMVSQAFLGDKRIITSFKELGFWDNPSGEFVRTGPIGSSVDGECVEWGCQNDAPRIFCYLSAHVDETYKVIDELRRMKVDAICVIRGDDPRLVDSEGVRIFNRNVNIDSLLQDANLVITYGGSGMVSLSLANGVPVLSIPSYIEQGVTAVRASNLNYGKTIIGRLPPEQIRGVITSILNDSAIKEAVRLFARNHGLINENNEVQLVVNEVKSLVRQSSALCD